MTCSVVNVQGRDEGPNFGLARIALVIRARTERDRELLHRHLAGLSLIFRVRLGDLFPEDHRREIPRIMRVQRCRNEDAFETTVFFSIIGQRVLPTIGNTIWSSAFHKTSLHSI